jgi:hypothetical protein
LGKASRDRLAGEKRLDARTEFGLERLAELKSLVTHPTYSLLEDIPVIKETDVARALKLCQEAGTDITAGRFISRAVTAPCESGPPDSVTTALAE